MGTIYNVDFFIKKFQSIPENLWCVGTTNYGGTSHCAWGHISKTYGDMNPVAKAFHDLLIAGGLDENGDPSGINNGDHPNYKQPTPKQRILAALYDIKKAQQPEVKERIVYVTVDEPVRELQKKELVEN